MIIAKNDEEKRSRIWRASFIVSSVLIVLIAIYLLLKMFTANPLEGSWESEDGGMTVVVGANGTMTVRLSDISEETDAKIKMKYAMDKDAKTITVKEDAKELSKLAEQSDGAYTEEALRSELSGIVDTFDYNVESGRLTLTEREYGEQITFIKK